MNNRSLIKAIIVSITISSAMASAMCLDDADYKSFRMEKNSYIKTPHGVFYADEVKVTSLYMGDKSYQVNQEYYAADDLKLDYLCKRQFGNEYSWAHVESSSSPRTDWRSKDFYIEIYNKYTRKISKKIPKIYYYGNTIVYACIKPLNRVVCDSDRKK